MAIEWAAPPHGIEMLAARWQGFCRWWLSGLRATLPQGWLTWIRGESIPRLMIRRDRDLVICSVIAADTPKEMRTSLHGFGLSSLNAWLADCNLTPDKISVGVAIDRELFFVRSLSLPAAAATALPKILEQDLLRRTPFQLADIWHGATKTGGDVGEVLTMQHWILRKDRAAQALTELGLRADDVDFLASNDADGNYVPVIWYREAMHEDPAWARRAIRLMGLATFGTVLLANLAYECTQFSIATSVATSLAEAKELAQAGGGRGNFNQKAMLFVKKSDVSILEIWNELSKILPDHTFLTESKITDGSIAISGFSADAARLVRLIDQSPLFTGAILVAGITPDATEHKDRFSITFKVRNARIMPSAGRSSKDRG
jgi:general secretion pathway protein L